MCPFDVIIYLMKIKLTILKYVFLYHNITLKGIWAAFQTLFITPFKTKCFHILVS